MDEIAVIESVLSQILDVTFDDLEVVGAGKRP